MGIFELHVGLRGAGSRILAALQQFVFGIDDFPLAERIRAEFVLHHDHVAWLRHGVVGLGRHNQPEHLQFRRDADLALGSVEQNLSQVLRPALGCDGPEDIGKILGAQCVGGRKILKIGVDFDASLFAIHLCLAGRLWGHGGSAKIDHCGPAAMAVVERLGGFCDDVDFDGGDRFELLRRKPGGEQTDKQPCLIVYTDRFVHTDRSLRSEMGKPGSKPGTIDRTTG